MSQELEEEEFVGDFDPENLPEEENIRYVFDPDTPDNEIETEDILYDPKRRKRTTNRKQRRTRFRRVKARAKRYYKSAKKRVKKRAGMFASANKMLNKAMTPIGFAMGLMADPMWDGRGISGAIGFMKYRLTHNWHLPSMNTIQWWLFDEGSPNLYKAPVFGGMLLGIGGMIASKLKLNPLVSNVSRKLSKLGWGLCVGGIVGMLVWLGGSENTRFTETPHSVNPQNRYTNTRSGINETQAYAHVLKDSAF